MLLCSSPFSLLLLDEYLLKHTSVTLYLLDFSEGSAFRVNLRLLRMLLEALVCPLPFVCVSWPWAQLQPLLHPLLPHAPLCFFLSSHPLLCPVDATAGPMHHFLWVQGNLSCFYFPPRIEVICAHVFCYQHLESVLGTALHPGSINVKISLWT